MEKYKQYDKKIKAQRAELKEAKATIAKHKQIANDEQSDSYQSTLNKLISSEKNLD